MAMSMTPDLYFEAFVRPSFEEFADHQDSVRYGFNACLAASHMADHYWKFCLQHRRSKVHGFKKIGPFLESLAQATGGAFRDVRSIANAFKHLYCDKDPHSSVSSAGTIEVVEFRRSLVRSVFEDDSGSQRMVFYTTKTGEARELLPVLRVVVDHWNKLAVALQDER